MGTGTKIALGCGIAVLVAGAVAIVGLGAGAYWLKGKAAKYVDNVAAKAEEISRYEKQANQNPFTPPADGVIQEAQLVKFLAVRKEIYAVYQQHKPEFESLAERTKNKKDLNFSETVEAGSMLARLAADVRLVQMKALAAARMSESEYRFIQVAVYQSAWAGEFEKEAGAQPSEYIAKGMEAQKQALRQGREALEKGQQAVAPGSAPLTDEQVRGGEQILDALGQRAKAMEVPKANIDLFRKHEAEIKKYAMTGLALVGL